MSCRLFSPVIKDQLNPIFYPLWAIIVVLVHASPDLHWNVDFNLQKEWLQESPFQLLVKYPAVMSGLPYILPYKSHF